MMGMFLCLLLVIGRGNPGVTTGLPLPLPLPLVKGKGFAKGSKMTTLTPTLNTLTPYPQGFFTFFIQKVTNLIYIILFNIN